MTSLKADINIEPPYNHTTPKGPIIAAIPPAVKKRLEDFQRDVDCLRSAFQDCIFIANNAINHIF
jgi:hypothetical protein